MSWPPTQASTLCSTCVNVLCSLPLSLTIAAVLIASAAAVYLLERFVFGVPYPPTIPLVCEKEGARRFSLRTRLAYYTNCKRLFEDAWEQHLKHGRPVVVPGMGFRKEVVLPPGHMRWALSQPNGCLSVAEAMAEMDQARWSLGHAGPVLDPWQGMLVKTEMNRVLESVCAALDDELTRAFDKHFGTDTSSWRELDLRATVTKAIAQANSRFTVGLPLCRNPDYLQTVLDINDLLITTGGVIAAMPRLLQPLAGSILGLPMTCKIRRIKQWLVPLWQQRLRLVQSEKEGDADSPQDHVQMMARFVTNQRTQELDDYGLIARRICAQNFGAVHQTSIQVSNLLLDVLGSDAEHNTISTLRGESSRILGTSEPESDAGDVKAKASATTPGRWTKARVNRMTLADSASRETLRLHSFVNRALMRKVMTPDLLTPDGHTLPRGTIISFMLWPAHANDASLPEPLTYDPFRFARMREGNGSSDKKPQTLVTTSPDYLPFGHGKHACPGRFIVDFELKMIVAHVLRNYDIRFPDSYEGKRPANVWITEATFPPPGARICVRRRDKDVIDQSK